MMKVNFGFDSMGIVGLGLGLLGIGYAAYREHRMNQLTKKIGMSMAEIGARTPDVIQDNIVDQAVKNAVEIQARATVDSAADKAILATSTWMDNEITKAVKERYANMDSEIAEKVNKRIEGLNLDDISDKARRKVEGEVLKKVLQIGNLGGMLIPGNRSNNFSSENLSAVSSILDQFWSDSEKKNALSIIFGNRN